jgi:hypothetical protein
MPSQSKLLLATHGLKDAEVAATPLSTRRRARTLS